MSHLGPLSNYIACQHHYMTKEHVSFCCQFESVVINISHFDGHKNSIFLGHEVKKHDGYGQFLFLIWGRCCPDRMIVGFTTTCAINAYHHFESCSWRGVLDTTLCDKVCQWLATGRSFSPVFTDLLFSQFWKKNNIYMYISKKIKNYNDWPLMKNR